MLEKNNEILFEKKLNKLIVGQIILVILGLLGVMYLTFQGSDSKELAPQELEKQTEKVCFENKNKSV